MNAHEWWFDVLRDVKREERELRLDEESPESLRDGGFDEDSDWIHPEDVRYEL